MRLYIQSTILSVILFLSFVSCNSRHATQMLNEAETYFGESLSSVNIEDDSTLWVASEYGNVWRKKGLKLEKFKIASERIYFFKRIGKYYWVGVRNGGLQRWQYDGHEFRHLSSYPIANKGLQYSCYDMLVINGHIVFSTSQGLFIIKDEKVIKIYPHSSGAKFKDVLPYVVKQLVVRQDGHLLAASEKGLLDINPVNWHTERLFPGQKINYVACDGEQTDVVMDGALCTIKGRTQNIHKLDFSPLFFYNVSGIYYFFDEINAYVTNDLKHFSIIKLRRAIPDKGCHLIAKSATSNFVNVLTNEALWEIPVHATFFNSNRLLVAACSDGRNLYFSDDGNNIYMKEKNKDHANRIFDFINEPTITSIAWQGNKCFFINSDRQVKMVKLSNNLWHNLISANTQLLYSSKAKITAFTSFQRADSTCLLLGVQDGMVRLWPSTKKVDTVKAMQYDYITAFNKSVNGDMVLVSTLNNGLIESDGINFRHKKDVNLSHIKDIVQTKGFTPSTVVLTNDKLVLLGSKDTLDASGVEKLLLADESTLYGISENGLRRYDIANGHIVETGRFFEDMHFVAQGSLAFDGKLYLSSRLGLMQIKPRQESNVKWIDVRDNEVSRKRIIFSLCLVIAMLAIFFYGRKCYASIMKRQENTLRKSSVW